MAEPWVDETHACPDDGCKGTSQPEDDGDIRYHACDKCGYECCYTQVRQDAGSCSLGVPEAVRRQASREPSQPLLLQLGKRPHD